MTAAPTRPSQPRLRLVMDDTPTPAPNLVHPAAPPAVTGPLRFLRAIGDGVRAERVTRGQAAVLRAMLEFLDFGTGETWAAVETIAAAAGMSEDGTARILAELTESGVIKIPQGGEAVGRRTARRRIEVTALEADPNSGPVDPIADRVYDVEEVRRPDRRSGQSRAVDPTGDRVKAVDPIGDRVDPIADRVIRQIIKPKAAAPRERTREGPEQAKPAAAAELSGGVGAGGQVPIAASGLPPVNAGAVDSGHVAGFAGTPRGRELLAELIAGGMRSGDAWALASRPDFDQDLAAYFAHRISEFRAKPDEGATRAAQRRGGLLGKLVREPREGLDGFAEFGKRRHKIRAAEIAAIWVWYAQRPDPGGTGELVGAWMEARGVPTDGVAWSRRLEISDRVFQGCRGSADRCEQAWAAIVEYCRRNP